MGGGGGFHPSEDGSQGGETAASQDVSDYDADPKAAPARVFIGVTRCLKEFQLKGDADKGIVRVCGGPGDDCRRTQHKSLAVPKGKVGVYDSIKTANYVDGVKSTFKTQEE